MSELKTSEVLDKAAEVVEHRGWTTGDWNLDRRDRPVCIEGAIFAAMGVEDRFGDEEYDKLRRCRGYVAVKEHLGVDNEYLCSWNDQVADGRPLHTKGEVVAVLRAAAEAERQKENEQ